MAVARRFTGSQRDRGSGLERVIHDLAVTLAAGADAVEDVNVSNREQFERDCRTLGLLPTDAIARHLSPAEVNLAKCRVVAAVRLTSTKTRETGVALNISGRVVDSFYQKRFGTETTIYQRLTVDLERVSTLDGVLVRDEAEREQVQFLLRAFVQRSRGASAEQIVSQMKEAQRFARAQTFQRVVILRSTDGWVCLLPPRNETGRWASLALNRVGEVRLPASQWIPLLPAMAR
jgi:hypothetical protein